jgi:ParB/RepB/Spo0J family partition protein
MAEDVQHEVRLEASLEPLPQYSGYAIPVAQVFYDTSFNCRSSFTLRSVEDLAASIQAIGLRYPVIVQPWGKDGFDYRLLVGHRRYTAVKLLQWPTIPGTIAYDLTEHQARLLNLTENLQRKELNPLEEAEGLRRLYPNGVPLRVAAKEVNQSAGWVHDRFRLLTLPDEIQQSIAAGLLHIRDVSRLVTLPTPEEQIKAAHALMAAKRRYGAKEYLQRLHPKYRRQFGRCKSKKQINGMVAKMFAHGITGLAPRMGSWCAGYITDREIEEEIRANSQRSPVS